MGVILLGVDFSASPSPAKPITVARACWVKDRARPAVRIEHLEALARLDDFELLLSRSGPWVGGFDFPFGLPRELVQAMDWPQQWPALIQTFSICPRPVLRERFRAFCAARPVGGKFAHRATDRWAGSSPSMKWVNPPVAWMLHAGAPRLLKAGVHIPGLFEGDRGRVALEAYPGFVARSITRDSYKSDDRARQTDSRAQARLTIIQALAEGDHALGVRVCFARAVREQLDDDPRGDWLDAVLCAVQAGWAQACGPGWGLPPDVDPLEGWIVGAKPC